MKHPLTAAGLSPAECRRGARTLELACLRGITGAVVQLVRIVSEIVCVLSQKRETPPDSQLCPQIIAP